MNLSAPDQALIAQAVRVLADLLKTQPDDIHLEANFEIDDKSYKLIFGEVEEKE